MQKFAPQAVIAPVLLSLALALSACGEKSGTEQAGATAAATDQAPENAPGIALTDAVVQLPAVAGRPGVAYFNISNGSGPGHKLVSVHIDGVGRTEMHETRMENGISKMAQVKEVALEPGKIVSFAAGGHHVMLFDLDPALKAGGTAEVTVTLDNGDKASATAKIRSVGDAAMDHGSMENHETTAHDGGHSPDHDMANHDMADHDM